MWPLFPCALPNIAVPKEGQQLVLVPTAPKRMFCLLFTRRKFGLGTWVLFSFFYLAQNHFLKIFMMSLMIPLTELISYDVNHSMDLISYLDAQHFYIVEDTYASCLKQSVNDNEKSTVKGCVRKG